MNGDAEAFNFAEMQGDAILRAKSYVRGQSHVKKNYPDCIQIVYNGCIQK